MIELDKYDSQLVWISKGHVDNNHPIESVKILWMERHGLSDKEHINLRYIVKYVIDLVIRTKTINYSELLDITTPIDVFGGMIEINIIEDWYILVLKRSLSKLGLLQIYEIKDDTEDIKWWRNVFGEESFLKKLEQEWEGNLPTEVKKLINTIQPPSGSKKTTSLKKLPTLVDTVYDKILKQLNGTD